MKNVNGTTEDLTLYHKNGKIAYQFENYSNGFISKYTYNENGNELNFENSNGYTSKYIYDENGNELTFEDSNDYYKIKGNEVTKEEFEDFVNGTK